MREEGAKFAQIANYPFRSFQRLLAAACTALETDAAMIAIIENDIVRVLATWGIPNDLTFHPQPFSDVPYGRYETVVIRDALDRADIQVFMNPPWIDRIGFNQQEINRVGFFVRTPLLIEGAQTAGLLVFGREPKPDVTEADIEFLKNLARSLSYSIEMLRGSETTANFLQTNGLTYEALKDWIKERKDGAALLTSDLTPVCASNNMERLLPFRFPDLNAIDLRKFNNPLLQNVIFYLDQVVNTGFSLPPLEISTQPLSPPWPFKQSLILTASPIRPLDRAETYLVITLRDVSVKEAFQEHVEASMPVKMQSPDMTTVEFLVETLVARRRVNSRRDTSYITMRSWRRSIRAHQITALKAVKHHNPRALAIIASEEIALDIKTLIGAQAFRGVVPIPCGHSSADKCMSEMIAQELGARLGLPVIRALHVGKSSGSSLPKANLKRPKMKLLTPVVGPVILVDDVATSGEHMREARELLMASCGSVFAIAWIGGDADDVKK